MKCFIGGVHLKCRRLKWSDYSYRYELVPLQQEYFRIVPCERDLLPRCTDDVSLTCAPALAAGCSEYRIVPSCLLYRCVSFPWLHSFSGPREVTWQFFTTTISGPTKTGFGWTWGTLDRKAGKYFATFQEAYSDAVKHGLSETDDCIIRLASGVRPAGDFNVTVEALK